jgi:hypothetical protein
LSLQFLNQDYIPIITGNDVLALMNERFQRANTPYIRTVFYPIMDAPIDSTSVPGVSFRYERIYGEDPVIAFFMDGSRMRIFGGSTGPFSIEKKITFDVAVINDNGNGWLTEGHNRSFWYAGTIEPKETDSISISDLTGGNLSTVSELDTGNYMVYVIVRGTSSRSSYGDFNTYETDHLSSRNVIQVYPTPYTIAHMVPGTTLFFLAAKKLPWLHMM